MFCSSTLRMRLLLLTQRYYANKFSKKKKNFFWLETWLMHYLLFIQVQDAFDTEVQPITDRVAQHLEIISKNFRFSTRRTRILMGFIVYYLVLIVNPMGRILVRWKSFRNNLEMLCHPICNWLYIQISHVTRRNASCHTYEWVTSHRHWDET